jgi:hypothetical protein
MRCFSERGSVIGVLLWRWANPGLWSVQPGVHGTPRLSMAYPTLIEGSRARGAEMKPLMACASYCPLPIGCDSGERGKTRELRLLKLLQSPMSFSGGP